MEKLRIDGNIYIDKGKTFCHYNADNPEKSFTLPSSVKVIRDYAFTYCKFLEHIRLPNGLKEIGEYAFVACFSLKSIKIPASVKYIGKNAFQNCQSLQKIEVDKENKNYKSIGGRLYTKDGKIFILHPISKKTDFFVLPETVKEIEEGAFRGCKYIKSVELPFCIKAIEKYTFFNCEKLEHITLPEGLEKIEEGAFEFCESLKSINIPASIREIGKDAFDGCSSITKIDIDRKNQLYKKIKGNIYTKDGKKLVWFLNQAATCFAIPKSVKEIGEKSFYGCKALMIIEIPESVEIIREKAFSDCLNLKKVKLSNGLKMIERNAFKGCESLLSIEIPASVEKIERWAFDIRCLHTMNISCSNKIYRNIDGNIYTDRGKTLFRFLLRSSSFTVPDFVKEIEEEAFSDNNLLKSITIPSNVKRICDRAFMGCYNLKSISLSEGIEEICDGVFMECYSLKKISIPEGIKKIGVGAFYFCYNLKSVSLPESLKEINCGAFYMCRKLKSINLPSNVKVIGEEAFADCSSLAEITLPKGLREIKARAFNYCSLKMIKIPASVKSIEKNALYCKTLREIDVENGNKIYKSIGGRFYTKDGKTLILYPAKNPTRSFVIPDTVTVIENGAFKKCKSLKYVKVPGSVKQIGKCAFSYCENLETVVLNEGLQMIDEEAFLYCLSLKSVKIPKSVIRIENETFLGCIDLKRVDRIGPGDDLSADYRGRRKLEKNPKVSKKEAKVFNAWVKDETKRLSRIYSCVEIHRILDKKYKKYETMFHDMPPCWCICMVDNRDIAEILAIVDGAIKRGISWWLLTGHDRTYQYGEILW